MYGKKISFTSILSTIAIATGAMLAPKSVLAVSSLVVVPTNDADILANTILTNGVSVSGSTYIGSAMASGIFSNGTVSGLPIDSGIILSSGRASAAAGQADTPSTSFGTPGDAQLTALLGYQTYDAASLSFDFILPAGSSSVEFSYLLASSEYQNYANTSFNDGFALFVDGVNQALLPGTTTAVSINTVNGGNPLPSGGLGPNPQNPQYFVNNSIGQVSSPNFAYWGYTTPFTAIASGLSPGSHTFKAVVADASDSVLDTVVLLQGDSFQTCGGPGEPECGKPPIDPAVPEPLTVLGSLTALGFGVQLKRKLAKKS